MTCTDVDVVTRQVREIEPRTRNFHNLSPEKQRELMHDVAANLAELRKLGIDLNDTELVQDPTTRELLAALEHKVNDAEKQKPERGAEV